MKFSVGYCASYCLVGIQGNYAVVLPLSIPINIQRIRPFVPVIRITIKCNCVFGISHNATHIWTHFSSGGVSYPVQLQLLELGVFAYMPVGFKFPGLHSWWRMFKLTLCCQFICYSSVLNVQCNTSQSHIETTKLFFSDVIHWITIFIDVMQFENTFYVNCLVANLCRAIKLTIDVSRMLPQSPYGREHVKMLANRSATLHVRVRKSSKFFERRVLHQFIYKWFNAMWEERESEIEGWEGKR